MNDIASQVAKAIAKAGAQSGDGTPLTATLVQQGPPSGPEWDPIPGERVEYSITIVDIHRVLRAGADLLGKIEHVLRMAAEPGGPTPSIADEVQLGDLTYSVADVKPVAPGGVTLLWELRLDR